MKLAADVSLEYDDRKSAQGKLDFDDLLAKAHDLITSPDNQALRKQIASDVELVLVDEFQDTDRLQADLIKALCGDGLTSGRLFFVGDFKQSIYRFRGAQPEVFHRLRSELAESGRLSLTENFRSRPGILNFVNALFSGALAKEGSPYEPLRPWRKPASDLPSVEFLWTPVAGKNSRKKDAAEAARRAEALHIAARLRELIDNPRGELPVCDKKHGEPRPCNWATSRFCFAPCRTCNSMKWRCGRMSSIITSSAGMRFMRSRRFSTCSTCSAPWPAPPTISAWPECSAARSFLWKMNRCFGSRKRPAQIEKQGAASGGRAKVNREPRRILRYGPRNRRSAS